MFQGGSLWAGVVSGVMSQFQHTKNYNKGLMSGREYAVHTAENATGAVGVMAGVEYGALLGTSMLPGLGTVVGAVIGGVLGDKVGRAVGQQTGQVIFRSQPVNNMTQPTTQTQA
ncbi:hypothetical protein E5161_01785 [Cohnella pontilimi]|uniref:Glycine zipper domain-containing protein n=1 Tax=Cohnella pontilimi TaxID=2564100 RepID=A0A4U0FKR1_9BACL|nr:glycine zipper domain-containing protein [Cohnella pontilimi]TJY44152.1 hypothetical protein E5161_01785 [Cohnella pontilimi]